MEAESPWPVLSQEAISKLASGVHFCFLRWTALQLAVENEWGGRSSNQKALQLENDILTWFVRSKGAVFGLCLCVLTNSILVFNSFFFGKN